ncbi:H-NS family nucleoid-associated regulatory protein [Cupriavidus basilensis]|uniref:H-NS family nucleoid-associated regulatory protein n=1 Tax=Cupriavidus basilensis TaxID=68895 RepID=A0ABT6B523_9BURK|nr:H-NS family nucleoid-associated regulatory protein [Cupriavidus basilensis]MDF3839984.1 H-NS family nucleoid-associated regulatory protein [Cupriavidus basilensis]
MSKEIERAEAITWIRVQMAHYDLTIADLADAGCFVDRKPSPQPARYRNAEGQTWDGQGAMPDWLQRAVNAGQSIEFFRIG